MEESGNVFSAEVVDHATHPRNAGSMDDADAYTSMLGSCGDNMEMWLKARDGRVKEVTFSLCWTGISHPKESHYRIHES